MAQFKIIHWDITVQYKAVVCMYIYTYSHEHNNITISSDI